MRHVSSPGFFRNWRMLDRTGLGRPIVKAPEKLGLV